MSTDGIDYKYSLCRQCIARDTVICVDGVDRILCDGRPKYPKASLQERIIAYVCYSLVQASSLQLEKDLDDWEIV